MAARGNGAPTPVPTAAGPGCHTAHVKGSPMWQRTETEQGKAENLLQRGNWGHYSAGSRCKRSPRTQTPTIKTQSQHSSGSTTTNSQTHPAHVAASRMGEDRDISRVQAQAACEGRASAT